MRQIHSSAAFILVIILLDVPAHPQSAPSSQMSANDLARRVITDELRFQDDHTNWMYRLEKEQCRRQSTDAASDITQSKVSPVSMDTWTGYGGVGDYIKSKGNTLEVLAAGHGIRDGEFDRLPANSIPIAHTHANPGLF
jgi:hypothetical protein